MIEMVPIFFNVAVGTCVSWVVVSPLEEKFWFGTLTVIDIPQYGAIETGVNKLLKHCLYKCSSQVACRLAQ